MDKSKFLKKNLPNITKYLDKDTNTIKSNSDSKEGLIVPEIVMTYGKGQKKLDSLVIVPKIIRTLIEAKKSYKSIIKNPNSNKTILPNDKLEEFKSLAYSLGVAEIGFTQVDNSMIFKDKEILYNNAIVFTMEMKRESIDLAPSLVTNKEIFRTYLELGKIMNILSSFLRKNGYNAQAGPALNGDVIYPLLAQNAGLGATGKHGLLISPNLGPSLRISAIYTDIDNLPINDGNDHLWIQDFCEKCNRCVKTCPGNAIYKDSHIYKNGTKKCIDFKKCAVPFARDYGCTVCVKECLFYKSNYYKIKEGFNESI